MSTYKDLSSNDVTTSVNQLNQVIDILGNFISGTTENSVQTYNQLGTSGTFQTVYDQDITSVTANKVFDMTFGQSSNSNLTGTGALDLEVKQDIYRQFAQQLLGNADSKFYVPYLSASTDSEIREAVFIGVKRLFTRDKIKENTTTLSINHISASQDDTTADTPAKFRNYSVTDLNFGYPNITPLQTEVTTLYSGTAGTTVPVGLCFLNQGVVVLDVSRSFDGGQLLTVAGNNYYWFSGPPTSGSQISLLSGTSIDDILDHVRTRRFISGSTSGVYNVGMEFQNVVTINSTVVSCDVGFEDFNLSSNPTFINNSTYQIRTLQGNGLGINNPTTFITSIGLHDAAGNLLAVAKFSRPVRKNRETTFKVNVRLDF